jgi:DNA polymerase-3 subunit epsilon/exodeoxyribonuclease X
MDFIFFDTETTGIGENDEVIQLSYVVSKDGKKVPMNRYYTPSVKISPSAMAVHHITPEKLVEKGAGKLDSNDLLMRGLEKMNSESNALVAHNIDFDLEMLKRHGFDSKMKHIDTLRCARHLLEDAEGYSLGVLYYQYNIYRQMPDLAKELGVDAGSMSSHDAMFDVMMLILLTRTLLRIAGSPEKLVELTRTPVMIKKFTFGKYKGEMIEDIVASDKKYLEWMLDKMDDLSEDMRYTLCAHLGRAL